MALSPRALRGWDRVHTWSSLGCALFLLILCLTGLPLIFHKEINAALAPPRAVFAQGTPMTLDALAAVARERYPGRIFMFMFWDPDTPGTVGLGLADRADTPNKDTQRVLFDAVTAAVVPARAPEHPAVTFLFHLHKGLMAGLAGELFLSLVALVFLVSVVSGIVLYAPFLRGRALAGGRISPRRARWLELHNLIGIAMAAWLLMMGATGWLNAMKAPLFGAWETALHPRLGAQPSSAHRPVMPMQPVSLDTVVATARAAYGNAQLTGMGFPGTPYATADHYMLWMRGTTKFDRHFFDTVLVDAQTGRSAIVAPLTWYLRVLELSRPLHFGDYGGLPFKIAWAVLDGVAILILGSGLWLYLERRRTAATRASRPRP